MPRPPRTWRRLVALAGLLAPFAACTPETPTQLGSGSRTPPDSLHVTALRTVKADSVSKFPVTLGFSPVGQLGRQLVYTTHVLYDFKVPTRVIQDKDTLQLDTGTFLVRTDSLGAPPFEGVMRLSLRQVALAERGWNVDSVRVGLPALEPGKVAPDTLITGSDLVDTDTGKDSFGKKITFSVNLASLAGFDSLQARGDTLDVNVAILFEGFDTGGPGFTEILYRDNTGAETGRFIGFSNARTNAIESIAPSRHMTRVEFDSTYSSGTRLAVSDGVALHSFLQFTPIRSFLPDSAAVHLAELVLTQVLPADGTSFGTSPTIGVMVPADTLFLSRANNKRALAFSAQLVFSPGGTLTIPVTPYFFDLQRGSTSVKDLGMILRVSNEGTKVRHFEFYGPRDPDPTRRPWLRLVYSLPASFEGGGRKPSDAAGAHPQGPLGTDGGRTATLRPGGAP